LQNKKNNYRIDQKDIVAGVGRPYDPTQVQKRHQNAYPRIIGSYGDKSQQGTKTAIKMMNFMHHFATSLSKKDEIVKMFQENDKSQISPADGKTFFDDQENLQANLSKMHFFYNVGVSNATAWAHPNTGDTVCSIMIGGLMTVMNGEFEIRTGDKIMWYFTFERDCFNADGSRKKITKDFYHDPEYELDENDRLVRNCFKTDINKRKYMDRQYDSDPDPKNNKAAVNIRVKPFVQDDDNPRTLDGERWFANAIGCARPNDLVDIKISRQSH
jgi:hypothetical protein